MIGGCGLLAIAALALRSHGASHGIETFVSLDEDLASVLSGHVRRSFRVAFAGLGTSAKQRASSFSRASHANVPVLLNERDRWPFCLVGVAA